MAEWAIDELDDERKINLAFLPLPTDKVHIDELDPADATLIRSTVAQIPKISSLMPALRPLSPESVLPVSTAPSEREELIQKIENFKTDVSLADQEPKDLNPAWEIINLGLRKEALTNNQINGHIVEVEKHQKDIDLLIRLNRELNAYKEEDGPSEEMKKLLQELKDHDIDLMKGIQEFDKETIAAVKQLTSTEIERLKAATSFIMGTKIAVLTRLLESLIEILRAAIQRWDRCTSTIISRQVQR